MCSETVVFTHSGASGNAEWIDVAGPEHKNVLVHGFSPPGELHIFIGDTAPAPSDEGLKIFAQDALDSHTSSTVRIEDAREMVWVRVDPTRSVLVIRGSAEMRF